MGLLGVALGDLAGDGGGAVDGLVAEGEAVDEHVREVDGADVGDVAEARTAVDEDVVVVGLHVVPQGVEEVAAAEPVVEVVPVEGGDGGRVLAVLPSGGDEVEGAAPRELPAERLRGERDGVRLDAGVVPVPVVGPLGGVGRGPGEFGDQVDHAGGGPERRGVEEGVEEPVESRGFQVPVDGQHPLAVGGEDPGGVGEGHGAPRAALVRVESDDAPVTTGCHTSSASVAGSCMSGMKRVLPMGPMSRVRSLRRPLARWVDRGMPQILLSGHLDHLGQDLAERFHTGYPLGRDTAEGPPLLHLDRHRLLEFLGQFGLGRPALMVLPAPGDDHGHPGPVLPVEGGEPPSQVLVLQGPPVDQEDLGGAGRLLALPLPRLLVERRDNCLVVERAHQFFGDVGEWSGGSRMVGVPLLRIVAVVLGIPAFRQVVTSRRGNGDPHGPRRTRAAARRPEGAGDEAEIERSARPDLHGIGDVDDAFGQVIDGLFVILGEQREFDQPVEPVADVAVPEIPVIEL